MMTTCLLDHFSALDDPRQSWKVCYPLEAVLVLCATMVGAEDFLQIERWGNRKPDFLRRFLPFAKGVPSHDTLNDVVNALPAERFQACFTAWVEALREAACDIVAIDGKTSRRSHDRAQGQNPLHLVSAWASRQRLVLGQQACEEKSNEITAIPALLARLALTCLQQAGRRPRHPRRHGVSDQNRRGNPRQGGGLSARSEGQLAGSLRRSRALLRGPQGRYLHAPRPLRRRSWPCRNPTARRVPRNRLAEKRDGKTSIERRDFLSSAKLSAKRFATAVRAHWHIENRPHWVMDIVFHDALMRLRTDKETLIQSEFSRGTGKCRQNQ